MALWFLKTLLLHARPETTYSHPRIDAAALKWDIDEVPYGNYRWLVTGEPPPAGLSLWVFRSEEGDDNCPPPRYRIPLPIVDADGTKTKFVNLQLTFHGISVTLVVHPGWNIRHPLERDEHAVRLWPAPNEDIDLTSLPVVPRNSIMWMRCRVTLKPGALGSPELPALEHTSNPFWFMPTVMPFVESWGV